MAKRFTDSGRWARPWYRKLPVHVRELWNYMLDACDYAGVWIDDLELAAMMTGCPVSREEFEEYLGPKFERIDSDKVFIRSFVAFQYGPTLYKSNSSHRGVIKKLEGYGILYPIKDSPKPLTRPLVAPSETPPRSSVAHKDKDKDKDSSSSLSSEAISACVMAWGETLTRFGIRRDPKRDEIQIARLVQAKGAEDSRLALLGAGFEAKTEKFDPAKHVSIRRVADSRLFEKFVNLGAQYVPASREVYEGDDVA